MKDLCRLPDVLRRNAACDEHGLRDACNLPRRLPPSERRARAARRPRNVAVHEDDLGGIGIRRIRIKIIAVPIRLDNGTLRLLCHIRRLMPMQLHIVETDECCDLVHRIHRRIDKYADLRCVAKFPCNLLRRLRRNIAFALFGKDKADVVRAHFLCRTRRRNRLHSAHLYAHHISPFTCSF